MAASIIFTFMAVLALSILFLFSGLIGLKGIFKDYEIFPLPMQCGLGYFFGMAVFLSSWRLLAIPFSARISFWLTVAAVVYLIFFFRGNFWKELREKIKNLSPGKFAGIGLLFIFLIIFQWALWFMTAPTPTDPFENFGSAHSLRYSNVSNYILENNYMPVLNQNIGQSLLALAPAYTGGNLPFFALSLWLGISVFFLFLAVYGIFVYFGLRDNMAKWGTFLFMFGNTALSFTHVLSIDSNTPFAMTSYTDATALIGTFLIFMLFVWQLGKKNSILAMLPVGIIFGIYWNLSGPQNIFAGGCLLMVLSISYIFKNRSLKSPVIAFSVIFLASVIAGALQGGMLVPKRLMSNVDIPGAAEVSLPGKYTGIKPELPYAIGWGYVGLHYGTPYDPVEKAMYVSLLEGGHHAIKGEVVYDILWRLESNFWDSLRVMFFPLLGLIAFYFLRKKNAGNANLEALEYFWNNAIWIYLFCFILTFSVIISGRKWEMSRFMLEPYALGLILFVISLMLFLNSFSARAKKIILCAVTLVMVVGPIINGLDIIHNNLLPVATLKQKLPVFFSNPGIEGQAWWEEAKKSNFNSTNPSSSQ